MNIKLDDVGGARELAKYRMDVAKEDLASAEKNFEAGDFRTANNRSYYAIYHAISACLALEHKAFKSHGQCIGAFNKDYIHTGIFPVEFGKKIKEAQDVRHSSDYDDFYIVSVESTKKQIENAKDIVVVIDKYIQSFRM
ncbi:MAG: HEPN domain-containing protein [Lachnospiraceae bacterium]|nr:HEPN domain-containing protein [Lachnospiraceae bacterium]